MSLAIADLVRISKSLEFLEMFFKMRSRTESADYQLIVYHVMTLNVSFVLGSCIPSYQFTLDHSYRIIPIITIKRSESETSEM